MKILTYPEQAARTMADTSEAGMSRIEFVKLDDRYLTRQESNDFIHAILGMVGESGEIDQTVAISMKDGALYSPDGELLKSVREEIGDFLWYSSVLARTMGWPFDRFTRIEFTAPFWGSRGQAVAQMAEMYKKWVFYGKPIDEKKLLKLWAEAMLHCWEQAHGRRNFETILEENIEKLRKRFPEKFTEAEAVARADE